MFSWRPIHEETARRVLGYPTVGESLNERMRIHGHDFRVATINLNQDWQRVSADLLGLFGAR